MSFEGFLDDVERQLGPVDVLITNAGVFPIGSALGYTDSVRLEMRGTRVVFSSVMPTLTNTAMVDGVSSARGLRNAEPEDIADAIVNVIRKPRPHVMVTKAAGLTTLFMRNFAPRALNEAIGRLIGLDRIFTDGVDVDERRGYEERARSS